MIIEDILNREVPLIRDAVLSREYGADVYYLDGSVFPITETVKDLRSASNILRDRKDGLDNIVYYDITWGNSGRSQAILVSIERENTGRNLLSFSIIPKGYRGFREDLELDGSIVVERDVSRSISEEEIKKLIYDELRKRNIQWHNVNTRFVSSGINEGQGYRRLGEAILRQNGNVEKIFVPYGSGEVGIGIYNFFKEKFDKGEISKIPTIVLAQIKGKKRIRGKNLTEDKTRTKYVAFEDKINRLVESGQIQIVEISERERNKEYSFLKEHGVRVEKTSALAFAGARKYNLNRNDNVVIINSGQGRSYKKKLPMSLYESNIGRIAASILLVLGSICIQGQYTQNRTQQRMEREFKARYGINPPYGPSVGDSLVEERQAFVKGVIVDNPYYNTRQYLEKLKAEGREFRKN